MTESAATVPSKNARCSPLIPPEEPAHSWPCFRIQLPPESVRPVTRLGSSKLALYSNFVTGVEDGEEPDEPVAPPPDDAWEDWAWSSVSRSFAFSTEPRKLCPAMIAPAITTTATVPSRTAYSTLDAAAASAKNTRRCEGGMVAP